MQSHVRTLYRVKLILVEAMLVVTRCMPSVANRFLRLFMRPMRRMVWHVNHILVEPRLLIMTRLHHKNTQHRKSMQE